MHSRLIATLIVVSTLISCQSTDEHEMAGAPLRFAVSFPDEQSAEPLDGRMLLMISRQGDQEPRFQINDGARGQQIFGIDVDGLEPGEPAIVDHTVFGFPKESLALIAPGEYWVQALLHCYETFHRADGHVVKLPMDRGEGQRWNRAPGNLYSTPQKIRIGPQMEDAIEITLDNKIPPIPDPEDTKYIKHVKIQSKLLSEFWGRPMELGACVLLPEGFDEHPEARYPLIVNHGHFPYTFQRLSRGSTRSRFGAGLQRALPVGRVQQNSAAVCPLVLQGVDRPRYAAFHHH